ncbi:histidine utilization repressor [Desulfofustis limnaeus]|jgi:GntR family histidine utilization transcriptional repressor|uniref:Histidine utilization repressor n=1 Tax=Desulfofustis limnaeus TaxID=2740163 RepID=A0ABM7W6J3_9BACT|nr:histidine utilization repressor [Desulfofustis limnaeus]MDX9894983.1 histidine utilization repressor [Desulfofustis sp.]BDD86561.1 histidine utilization repressor [Desulfofustis limnaeus]
MNLKKRPKNVPLYKQIKARIVERIERGELRQGMRIESEAELVDLLGVSRMTVNRALRELTAEGRLIRIQGRGTFVADRKPQSVLLEIKSVAEVIKKRGGRHSCTVHLLKEEKAKPVVAAELGLPPYSPVFHSIVVHRENNIPIQLGCRYVNPVIAPHFLEQDFTKKTVTEYLLSLAPASAVQHVVEALIPDNWIRELLEIGDFEPCLALYRKTWVGETIATYSIFYYPGSRYTLAGMFTPAPNDKIAVS